MNEFSRKAFLECKQIYDNDDYYKIYDLTEMKIKNIFFQEIVPKIIKKEINNYNDNEENDKEGNEELPIIESDDYTNISDFENDFDFKGYDIRM